MAKTGGEIVGYTAQTRDGSLNISAGTRKGFFTAQQTLENLKDTIRQVKRRQKNLRGKRVTYTEIRNEG